MTLRTASAAGRAPTPPDRLTHTVAVRWWLPVVLLAALLAFADGFWLTSLRGAIGAIERTQSPFASWWHDSALALPVFVVAVAVPLRSVRRRTSRADLGRGRVVLTTGLRVLASTTAVGVAWAVTTSVRDYQLQARLLGERATLHPDLANAAVHAHAGHALPLAQVVQERHATFALHVLGVEQAAGVLLVTNLLLVAWFAAVRGGRLDTSSAPSAGVVPTAS